MKECKFNIVYYKYLRYNLIHIYYIHSKSWICFFTGDSGFKNLQIKKYCKINYILYTNKKINILPN